MKRRIDVTSIPQLRTSVGMYGSLKQNEVAGPWCLAALCILMIAL